MNNFGRITDMEVQSKSGKKKILHVPNQQNPGFIREFLHHSGPTGANQTVYYRCKNCRLLKERQNRQNPGQNQRPVPTISARDGDIKTDHNNPKQPHFCGQGTAAAVARADEVVRDARQECRRAGKRPREAYGDSVVGLAAKFPHLDQQEREDIEASLPAFRSVRRGLERNRNAGIPPIRDIMNIPGKH
ncbi:MAG: hypothetical protein GY696_24905 [Gammaproteobacteria bacterium]|nr:hypothetical protein [Gammaproteobacteria bacterium]